MQIGAKILLLDIETSPLLSYTWGLFDQNVGLNQIHKDWHLLSFAAKWLGSKEIIYKDQRKQKNIEDDLKLCEALYELLDEADIVVGQNSKRFDTKKINARFAIHKMKPPSSYRHIDTMLEAKKNFAFTSNKLEYLSGKLCNTKKLTERKFAGFDLWKECLRGNAAAWKELEAYNKQDVIALEELFWALQPWIKINLGVYLEDDSILVCACGSTDFYKNGYVWNDTSKFQRWKCRSCGAESRDRKNLLSKKKKAWLRLGPNR